MTDMAASRTLIFMDDDLSRPRMAVENEKMKRAFPGMRFYGTDGNITSVQGYLKTSDGNSYYIKIEVPSNYPYVMPTVTLPNTTIAAGCPHRYNTGNLCIMKSEQWSSSYSLAFMVAKAALWINKYDIWKRKGSWPGKEQQH